MIRGGTLHAVPDPVTVTEAPVLRPTIWQQNAELAATRNREASALTVLDVAVKMAIVEIREDRPGRGLFMLEKALLRAERILGPARSEAFGARADEAVALGNSGRQP